MVIQVPYSFECWWNLNIESKWFILVSSSVICSQAVSKETDSLCACAKGGGDCIQSYIKYFMIHERFIHSQVRRDFDFTVLSTKRLDLDIYSDWEENGWMTSWRNDPVVIVNHNGAKQWQWSSQERIQFIPWKSCYVSGHQGKVLPQAWRYPKTIMASSNHRK